MSKDITQRVINGFGDEWSHFDQSKLTQRDLEAMFASFFDIFPWHDLPENAVGFDLGCGSGRWGQLVAPKVGLLHCIDPSPEALQVAKKNLRNYSNCVYHLASSENIPLPDDSADFGYALGVLHHTGDPLAALKSCTTKLKPGAPFLLYLYYAFDNRPSWFRKLWKTTDVARKIISKMPFSIRYITSQIIAAVIYFPLARIALYCESFGINIENFPLAWYRDKDFYVMKTDALDRFGTIIEKRFTKKQIYKMMKNANLENIIFQETIPHWVALGYKILSR